VTTGSYHGSEPGLLTAVQDGCECIANSSHHAQNGHRSDDGIGLCMGQNSNVKYLEHAVGCK
jgi:hypothetical protein